VFKRIKHVFTVGKDASIENQPGQGTGMRSSAGIRGNTAQAGPEWAGLEGVACTVEAGEGTFCVSGELGGHPWRVERAPASRDYLVGEELRGRAEIAINGHVTVVIMNRALKEMLEKRAYSLYTDTLETQASPVLTEEMRWLALYPEAGWDSLSDAFFHRYAILAERRADAMAWLTPELVELLMGWPEPAPDNTVPFILMLMRGKAHLRMQALPHAAVADLPAQIHAVRLLVNASGVAVAAFPDVAPGSVKK
jgi:hypothetical protein